jgi:hypothetical protein
MIMNAAAFTYDVFLSHSAKDTAVVRPLAERLRQDGLKVSSHFGFRICAARHVGECVRLGSRLVGIGGRHVPVLEEPAVTKPLLYHRRSGKVSSHYELAR